MPQFRKKPIMITAEQWFPDKPVDGVEYQELGGMGYSKYSAWAINTLEGPMHVSPGDWIITGVKGEKYPCKPDIFEATYDLVRE